MLLVQVLVGNAQAMLGQLRPFWPQMDMEGTCNWWIVKPGGRCCGNGILIRNHLDHITNIVSPSVTRETRYVVQKYIGQFADSASGEQPRTRIFS